MNRRALLGCFLTIVSLATLCGLWGQRRELAALQAEQQQLAARLAAAEQAPTPRPTTTTERLAAHPASPALVATPELLRLRNEVTRLTERRRELGGVRAENERLRTELAGRGTNGSGGLQLPPGYIRKSQAAQVGYNMPEDTLQSFLWAIQNRDLTNLLQALTPTRVEHFLAPAAGSGRSLEPSSARPGLAGMAVIGRQQSTSDGAIDLQVQVVPGVPPIAITFQQTNGQWKIAGPF